MIPSSAEGLAAFDQMLLDACSLMRPPEQLTVAEWADKYGMLSAEGSAEPGKWYTSNAEYQREPMEALSDPRYQTVVLVWASQVGKTQIGLFFFAYHAHHDPAPMLFIEPTEDLAKVIVKDRVEPMIRDTPQLREIFALRTGKKDTYHKPFPGGQLSMGWANSPSQLASRPIRILITDEEGRYDANKEGDPVDQARKRMATFKTNRKHLRVSSPALRRTCRITKAYEASDKRRYYVPCPQCGHMQTLRWEQVRYVRKSLEPGNYDLSDCYYVCELSGCEITEADKFGMVRAGEWRAENPGGGDGKTAGYQLSSLYSTIGYTWAEIASDYLKCEGIPDKLQVFTNTVLGEPWDEQAEGADLNAVQKHAEEYSAEAPDWAVILTCGTDVQKDRIEATIWGWGLNDVSGAIEHRVFHGDPLKPEVWAEYTAWRRRRREHATGLHLPVACTFIDSGDGNRTQAVYDYCRKFEGEGVRACKGSSQNGAPIASSAKRVGRQRVLLVLVGSSTAKDTLYGRLGIEDRTKPGYVHFPSNPEAGCNKDFYVQLTAEKLVTHHTRGGERSQWENTPGRRNEALDCAVYALAAKEFTRAPMRELARKLAAKAAQIPEDQRPGGKTWLMGKFALQLADKLGVGKGQPSPSSASSQASPSPAAKPRLKRRRTLRLPGSSWIHGG